MKLLFACCCWSMRVVRRKKLRGERQRKVETMRSVGRQVIWGKGVGEEWETTGTKGDCGLLLSNYVKGQQGTEDTETWSPDVNSGLTAVLTGEICRRKFVREKPIDVTQKGNANTKIMNIDTWERKDWPVFVTSDKPPTV